MKLVVLFPSSLPEELLAGLGHLCESEGFAVGEGGIAVTAPGRPLCLPAGRKLAGGGIPGARRVFPRFVLSETAVPPAPRLEAAAGLCRGGCNAGLFPQCRADPPTR